MKRFLKYGVVPVVTFLFLLCATIIVLPVLMNVQKYLPEIEEQLSDVTGRSVTIGSNFGISFFPWLSISFSDLKIANPDGFQSDGFIKIESFEARLKLLPLLTKDIEVSRFIAGGLEVNLETSAQGAVNWDLTHKNINGVKTPTSFDGMSGWSLPEDLSVTLLAVTDGRVNWLDDSQQTSHTVEGLMLLVNDFTVDKPVSVEFKAAKDGRTIMAEGKVGPYLGKKSGRGVLPLDLALVFGKKFSGKLKGELTNLFANPGYDIDLQTDIFSGQDLLAYLGISLPRGKTAAITDGLGNNFNSISVNLSAKGDKDKLIIEKSKIEFDDTQLALGLVMKNFSQPELVFSLDADRLNLDRYLVSAATLENDQESQGEQSQQIIDPNALRQIKMTGAMQVKELKVGGGTVGDLSVHLRGVDGILGIDPVTFNLYQGEAEADMVINLHNDVPETNMNLELKDVRVGPLLHDFIKEDFISGAVSGKMKLLFSGSTGSVVKSNLSGNGELTIKEGAIVGVELLHAVKNVVQSASDSEQTDQRLRTEFTELKSRFSVKKGVVKSGETSLSSNDERVYISGTVDLIKENLQLEIKPSVDTLIAQEQGKGQGNDVMKIVPFELSGNFNKPNIDIAAQYLPLEQLNLSDELDMQILVDEKLPSPVEEDVRDLVGTPLIDPTVVANRFGLQPELLKQTRMKKLFTLGSGKVLISPLQEQEAWEQ